MTSVIAPTPDGDDQYFWDGVASEKLLLQRCAECSCLRQPPSPMCPHCQSLAWDTQEASGRARVYSWVASHHPNDPLAKPRIVVLLDLEEGVRFVSNLIDISLEDVRHGLEVELVFADYPRLGGPSAIQVEGDAEREPEDLVRLPQFRPVQSASPSPEGGA